VIESVNGRNTLLENFAVNKWRRRYDLTECGGSDAHTPNELGRITTRFSTPIRTRSELVQALKNRLCQPEVHAASARYMTLPETTGKSAAGILKNCEPEPGTFYW
jgi:hypothetical protein